MGIKLPSIGAVKAALVVGYGSVAMQGGPCLPDAPLPDDFDRKATAAMHCAQAEIGQAAVHGTRGLSAYPMPEDHVEETRA